ncbi:hypothetical protein M5F00_01295 [Acinetobacter sp. ANC 4945]|uniref:Terminase small subunit n=1 Tax=Acinetobacter amyesii TaxID=2942470 RepID=A0A1T1H6V5_9GAMM|nr:terminase small subunit [Acinetobacter amyesii]MCL6246509.1 hypothetical protein [Acinetobacter amyesii]OOV85525.1 hypothetical protein B1202_02465 [Acinetobacter amyesii]
MALTEQMKKFARAKLKNDPVTGKQLSNKQAAIEADYSEKSAGSKGSQLAKNPEVIAYLDGLLKLGGEGAGPAFESMSLGEAAIQADMKEMESVTNSLEYLRSIYKNSRLERKVRIEAAKAALPYEFGKVGEMGIKEGREQAAGEVAKTSKFATADERRKQRENQRVS